MLEAVKEFYEDYPYPRLPIKTKKDLLNKMHVNVMSNILATARIKAGEMKGRRVLDAGCGTGEKACYFSLYGAKSFGLDISSTSLKLARENAKKLKLKVNFIKADILDLPLMGKFDHIFSLGVLHHTENPYGGFVGLSRLLKKDGTITIGLYNKYGRFVHRVNRKILELINGKDADKKLEWVAKNIYRRKFKSEQELAYVADKYAHPYESYHTIGEVVDWFKKNEIALLGIYPEVGSNRYAAQARWLFERKGFFIVSGRKN